MSPVVVLAPLAVVVITLLAATLLEARVDIAWHAAQRRACMSRLSELLASMTATIETMRLRTLVDALQHLGDALTREDGA